MVRVDVQVAEGMYEVTDLEVAHMCDQVSQQRVARDIERHAEEGIGGALVELAMQGLSIFDLELKQRVTRRQSNLVARLGMPAGNDQTTRVRVRLDLANEPLDLVDAVALGII